MPGVVVGVLVVRAEVEGALGEGGEVLAREVEQRVQAHADDARHRDAKVVWTIK